MGDDESVMEWVDMANIACGFHASDPHVMSKTIKLALSTTTIKLVPIRAIKILSDSVVIYPTYYGADQ